MMATHRDCGGEVTERWDEELYRYCSEHDDADCECAFDVPVLRCDKCGEEIGGDWQLVIDEAWEEIVNEYGQETEYDD